MRDRSRHLRGILAIGRQLRLGLLAALATAAPGLAMEVRTGVPPIVVILDSTEAQHDSYLDSAWNYYRSLGHSPLRAGSLLELHNLLVNHSDYGDRALGEVVLVAHGSTWTGAAIDLFPGGTKASVSSMRVAADSGAFPPLPAGSVGAQTRISLDSCAVGRHLAWLGAFAELWVDEQQPPPALVASSRFVAFAATLNAVGEVVPQRVELPVHVSVSAGPAQAPVAERLQLLGDTCAPIQSPCERRQLPIRVEVELAPQLASASAGIQRKQAQRLARAQLEDLNLRADQISWARAPRDGEAGLYWVGSGMALVTTPLLNGDVQ